MKSQRKHYLGLNPIPVVLVRHAVAFLKIVGRPIFVHFLGASGPLVFFGGLSTKDFSSRRADAPCRRRRGLCSEEQRCRAARTILLALLTELYAAHNVIALSLLKRRIVLMGSKSKGACEMTALRTCRFIFMRLGCSWLKSESLDRTVV